MRAADLPCRAVLLKAKSGALGREKSRMSASPARDVGRLRTRSLLLFGWIERRATGHRYARGETRNPRCSRPFQVLLCTPRDSRIPRRLALRIELLNAVERRKDACAGTRIVLLGNALETCSEFLANLSTTVQHPESHHCISFCFNTRSQNSTAGDFQLEFKTKVTRRERVIVISEFLS